MSPEPRAPLPAAPRPHPQVVSSQLGDGGVLVHLGTNRIFELNTTGFRVWQLVGEGLDLAAVLTRLRDEFEVDEGQLRAEMGALVQALLAEGLLDAGRED